MKSWYKRGVKRNSGRKKKLTSVYWHTDWHKKVFVYIFLINSNGLWVYLNKMKQSWRSLTEYMCSVLCSLTYCANGLQSGLNLHAHHQFVESTLHLVGLIPKRFCQEVKLNFISGSMKTSMFDSCGKEGGSSCIYCLCRNISFQKSNYS